MAKPLIFKLEEKEFQLEPVKLDRKKLYGWSEKIALDEQNNECELLTFEPRTMSILPSGAVGQGMISQEGEWVERSQLKAVTADGTAAEKIPSAFDAPIVLDQTVSEEEFLDHYITAIYTLQGEENCPEFVKQIAIGPIFTFQFSYRAGFNSNPAFLVESQGELFVLVGKKSSFEFVGYEQVGYLDEEDDTTESFDDFDFGMM